MLCTGNYVQLIQYFRGFLDALSAYWNGAICEHSENLKLNPGWRLCIFLWNNTPKLHIFSKIFGILNRFLIKFYTDVIISLHFDCFCELTGNDWFKVSGRNADASIPRDAIIAMINLFKL